MKRIVSAIILSSLFSTQGLAVDYYWDADLTATGNNATTGDNLGGSGDWDNLTTANWWDGVSAVDSQWDDFANSGAIFWGAAGFVTLPSDRTASSLAFKTSGYTVTGSTLNLSGPATISVDTGVIADVGSILAGTNGYSVNGGGILNLNGLSANTITGAVSVSGGSTLAVTGSSRFGGATGDITLDNGTISNNDVGPGNLFLAATRNINIGSGGGTIDTPNNAFVNPILLYGGTISGTGNTLTKTGTGEIRMNGSTDFTFEKLVIQGDGTIGGYSLGQAQAGGRDGQLGAEPASFLQDQITLDGGFLRINNATPIILNANRGITITANNGRLLPSTTATIPGKITGPGNLSIGIAGSVTSGAIVLNSPNNDWEGPTLTINSGTLRAGVQGAIPATATNLVINNIASAILDLNGTNHTFSSLSSLTPTGANAGSIALGSGTLTVGDFSTTNYNGSITGPGTFIKEGTGTLIFNGLFSNTGGVIINEGTLQYNSNSAGIADTVLVTINENGVLDMGGGFGGPTPAPANDLIGDIAGSGRIENLIGAGGANNGLRIGGSGTTVFSGSIKGSGTGALRIVKTAGSLTLTGNDNTYEGGTIVTNGKLFVNNTNLASSGTGSGAVTISGTTTLIGTVGGTGSISGQVNVNAGGHLSAGIGGANAVLTTTKVVTAANSHIDATLGSPTNSDVLRITDGVAPLTVAANSILTAAATTAAVNGVYTVIDTDVNLGSLPSFTFNNATGYDGNLQLSGDSTNVEVNITGTTLQDRSWVNDAPTGNWSAATADQTNWGTIQIQPNGPGTTARFLATVGANPAHTVTISDTNKTVGTLILDNTTSYNIAAAGPHQLIMNTYSGNAAINVNSGTHTISAPVTLTVTTDINVADGIATDDLTMSGVVTNNAVMNKTGTGTLTITRNWQGAGVTNINEGTLRFSTASAGLADFALVSINGANSKLDMNAIGDQFGDLAGDGQIILGGSSLRLAGAATTTFSGSMTGTSPLILRKTAGSLNLSRADGNTYGGGTTIEGGTLLANNTDLSQSATGGGAVTVTSTTTLNGTLGGSGSIAGLITVNSGGTLSPGNSIGTLTAKGGLVLNAGSILNFELDTVMGIDVSDQVDVTLSSGLTINGGTLNLINAGGMTAGTYTLINYVGSFSGTLSNLSLGTQPDGFDYSLVDNMTNTSIDLLVTSTSALPGDYNNDGFVNAADYVMWRDNPNGFGGTPDGYNAWKANFGATPGSGSNNGLNAAVPEPTAVGLLLIAMALFCFRRRMLGSIG